MERGQPPSTAPLSPRHAHSPISHQLHTAAAAVPQLLHLSHFHLQGLLWVPCFCSKALLDDSAWLDARTPRLKKPLLPGSGPVTPRKGLFHSCPSRPGCPALCDLKARNIPQGLYSSWTQTEKSGTPQSKEQRGQSSRESLILYVTNTILNPAAPRTRTRRGFLAYKPYSAPLEPAPASGPGESH